MKNLGDVVLETKENTPLLQKSSSISSTSTDTEVIIFIFIYDL